jgi:FkbM family methyltransferase
MTMRVIEGRHGRIIVPENDVFVGRGFCEYGEFSEGEVEVFEQIIKPGMVVADIGANFGAHTLVFAKLAEKVYAYEPQRMVYNALCGTVALNLLYNVVVVNAAIGEENGFVDEVDLDLSRINNVGAVALESITPEMASYKVPILKFSTPCNFMKIDVEGMEELVLRGSSEMIRKHRPILYVENDRRDKSESLITYIRSLGYTCYWHHTALFNPNNFFKNAVNVWNDGYTSINMICVPWSDPVSGLEPVTSFIHPVFQYAR